MLKMLEAQSQALRSLQGRQVFQSPVEGSASLKKITSMVDHEQYQVFRRRSRHKGGVIIRGLLMPELASLSKDTLSLPTVGPAHVAEKLGHG